MDDKLWTAVKNRDSGAEGTFVYAVKTTGIYCRPGCSSRLPKRSNVEFYSTAPDAEHAGYRPCKRCSPDSTPIAEVKANLITAACRRIESSPTQPSLAELAAEANMSQGHFHRLFKKLTGITPKEYASSKQSDRFLEALDDGNSITTAVYEAGYSGPGRAYDQLKTRMGMTPSDYGKGAPGITIRYALAECFLGWTLVAATDRGICAVMFGDDPSELPGMLLKRFTKADLRESSPDETEILKRAIAEIDTPPETFSIPLDIIGTAFQKRVWKALMEVPPGETAGYGDIAERIGRPKAVRAVASACGANRIALFIPCHRIIRRDGGLGGYRWGLERKRIILERERHEKAR